MGFWKVLGGAAGAIACVVALPIAGPVGAITAVGAAVAGGIGAAAGGIASVGEDDEITSAEQRGEAKAKAEYEAKYTKLYEAFKEAELRIKAREDYFNLIIAMEAVGVSCAACDGHISDEERIQIDEFIAGVTASELPQDVKDKIKQIADNPPNIKTAFELAKKTEPSSYALFDEVIQLVMYADGYLHEKEKVFMQTWQYLKAA